MKRRKSGRTSIWYALFVLAAVLAVGYVGVKFGLERGNIRRARLALESASSESVSSEGASSEGASSEGASSEGASSEGTSSESISSGSASGASDVSSGETSPDTDTGSGEDKDAKSSLAVPNVSEAKRTQSILAEMSKEAKGEDSSRLRGVVTAGVPDVVAWAAENSGGKSKRSR